MTTLRTKARLALEGSDRSGKEALRHVRDYLEDLGRRATCGLEVNDFTIELVTLLFLLEELSDPDGDSAYVLRIIPRKSTGAPPKPDLKRKRQTKALIAAIYADKLIEKNPDGQKKKPVSLAAAKFGVTVAELYAARKSPLYLESKSRPELTELIEKEGFLQNS